MIKKKTLVILQARTNSKRLPGKVLMPILGLPLAIFCWSRIKNSGLKTYIATSNSHLDDKFVSIIKKYKINFFRGSLNNVLKRFVDCSKDLKLNDIIIRLTADNPLVDGNFVKKCLLIFLKKKFRYFSSHDNVKNCPFGISVEIFRRKYLLYSYNKKCTKYDLEHVTPAIRRKYLEKKKINMNLDHTFSKLTFTIDTMEDYLKVKKLFLKSFKYEKFEKILKQNYTNS